VAVAAAGLAVAVGAATADARARLDPTFGAGRGYVTTAVPGGTSLVYGVAAVPGGGIVTAGQVSGRNGNGQIVVARYRSNGSLDRSFASNGLYVTRLPRARGPFLATSIARQPSTGKLIVAGGYGPGSMLALRLTANGRLDRSFGGRRTGMTIIPAGGIAQSLLVQRNGAILLGGSNANANGRPMVVARLTANGSVDRRFGRQGRASVLFWNADLAASAGVVGMAVTRNGTIVGAGHLDYIGSDGHGSAGVFALDPDGSPASRYGTNGSTEVAFTRSSGAFAQWFPCALSLDSQGRVTVTGNGSVTTAGAVLSARLTAAGGLDPTFGGAGDGRSVLPGVPGDNDTTCGATAAQGNLTVGVGPVLAQLSSTGTPNASFAPGGLLRITTPTRTTVNAVAGSGRNIVAAGSAGRALYVARYRTN
jgi:uncharacterized delta-60 repeat protein